MLGGIEAGGTKFVCVVGTGPDDIRHEARFPTTTPPETLGKVVSFFGPHRLEGIGVGSFGPLDLDPASPSYGHITKTPKREWANTDLRGFLGRTLGAAVTLDTDVNAAVLGEHRWGAARGIEDVLYLTVGTGIGGGALVGGKPVHGLVHPEMGHVRIPRDPKDSFPGVCPFHGDCLEGLASGPAIERRWGRRGEELPDDHPAWDLEARDLALGVVGFVCTLSPRLIIIGGGVARASLLPRVSAHVERLLNGYVQAPAVVAPGLGARAGVLGALVLAKTGMRPSTG
jgi:fructokinase